MPHRYIPMMKTKSGEFVALGQMNSSSKNRVFPIFHVTSSVAASFFPGLATAWNGSSVAVDGLFSFNDSGSVSNFNATVRNLRTHNLDAIPSISTSADARLVAAALLLLNSNGIVVRCSYNQLIGLNQWIAAHSINPADVDVVVELGHIAAISGDLLASIVVQQLNQNIGLNHPYRSVTLASAAAPKDHGDLPRGISIVPRLDWALWENVRQNVQFQLDYGDFLTGHPDLTEPPGFAMSRATVSARYTGTNDWVIIKGRSTTGNQGIPMGPQYRTHATSLLGHFEFGGLPNCWADDRIRDITTGAATPGNRTKWSEIACNRHLEKVVSQLP